MGACDTAQRQTTQQTTATAPAANPTAQISQPQINPIDPNVPVPDVQVQAPNIPTAPTVPTGQATTNQNNGLLGGLFNNQQQQDSTPFAQQMGNKAGNAVYNQLQQRGYVGGQSDPNSTMGQFSALAKNMYANYSNSNATTAAAGGATNTAAQAGFGQQFKQGFTNAFSK